MANIKWLDFRTQLAPGILYVRNESEFRIGGNFGVLPIDASKRRRTWIQPESPMPGQGPGGFNIWGLPPTPTKAFEYTVVARNPQGSPLLLNPLDPQLQWTYEGNALAAIKLALDFWAGSGVPYITTESYPGENLAAYNFSSLTPEIHPPLALKPGIILVPGDLARACGCTLPDDIVAIDYQEFAVAVRPPEPLVETATKRVATIRAICDDGRYTPDQKCSAILRAITNYKPPVNLT